MSRELSRLLALAVFWVPFFAVPWLTGWSFASNVRCAFCWGEILRFAFSLFGYGTIGCLFYALTGEKKEISEFKYRLFTAMGVNACFFLGAISLVADWEIINL
jgi:hypothetical protein